MAEVFKGVKLEGFDGLDKMLAELPEKVQKRLVPQAIKMSAPVLLAAVKSEAPELDGLLKSTLKIQRVQGKGRAHLSGYEVVTGTREELGIDPNDKYYYPAAIELGTEHIAANPFIKRGTEDARNEVINIIGTKLAKDIVRTAKRLAKQGSKK